MVSNIFYFHPSLGKISNLTNIFQMGWNHQPEQFAFENKSFCPKKEAKADRLDKSHPFWVKQSPEVGVSIFFFRAQMSSNFQGTLL